MKPSNTIATLLVVDDKPNNLSLLTQSLQEAGYRIATAKTGQSALTKASTLDVDLILLDVMILDFNGFEVCHLLKANPTTAKIPVIFMTALTDTASKVTAFKSGAVDYVTKPIHIEEVLVRVETHLTLRRTQNTLEKTIKQLQSTQVKLVQQEKMASLGQLVAGVAHEINNPVNFIYNNIEPAKSYIGDLISLANLYKQGAPLTDIYSKSMAIDLEFIVQDLPKLMDSIELGAERIQKIVQSLQNFSRTDQSGFKETNLIEGIENTLLILQHRLKLQGIRVVKSYSLIPPVKCNAGQINQVLMNILTNAIDALESSINPMIEILTKSNHETVSISICDNGSGVPTEIQHRLFDPFFTTKQVGKGTGLGLSISYQIIEQHKGKLNVKSIPGQQTVFEVNLPINE